MLLAFMIAAAAALTDPSHAPSTGNGVVRGVLLDTASKPVDNAQVELWTRPQDSSEPTARGWHQRLEVSTPAHGKFEIGRIEPGSWILVARFEGNTSQEFIIQRFTIAAGETKDLGELHPTGKEHSARLAILDPAGADITEQVVKSDGKERSRLVRFDLVHRATADDPPLSWSFVRPCGSPITLRGLDALGDGWELQPRTDESRLLPGELGIHGTLRPIAKIGADHADPVALDLFTSRARRIEFQFGSSEKLTEESEFRPGYDFVSGDDRPVRVALVDKVGNVRVFHMHLREPALSSNVVSLTPGAYQLYAYCSSKDVVVSDELFGTANQSVEVSDEEGASRALVRLKSGVTIQGTARTVSAFRDPRERRALTAGFTGLVFPRTLLLLDEPENMGIDVPLGDGGTFIIYNLPPAETFAIGLPGLSREHATTLAIPFGDTNVGEIVIP